MDASRRQLPQVPAACTLGVTDGAAQLQRWRRLGDRALVRRVRESRELLLVYRSDDGTKAELESLVAVETTCCAFLDWQVEEQEDDLRLHVRGTAGELDTLDPPLTSAQSVAGTQRAGRFSRNDAMPS